MMSFEGAQKFGSEAMDATLKSFGAMSKGMQAAATETADYAKRVLEQGSGTVEKLVGARSFDRAVEIQNEFLRSSYESFVTQTTRMGELAASTAKEVYAPVEVLVAKPRAA